MGYLDLAKRVAKNKFGISVKSAVPQTTLQPIQFETLNAIFEEASEKLSTIYKGGEFEYCRVHHPELYQAERVALNRVDEIWFEALAGKVSLDVFRQAVNRWYECVITLVNAHIEVKNEQEIR